MKKVVILIIDSLGIGAMDDAPSYGDSLSYHTLYSILTHNSGLHIPTLQKMGLGNIEALPFLPAAEAPMASFGKMKELSKGKDSTTGHWEIAGIVSEQGFRTYPDGFPDDLMQRFVLATGCGGFLGNKPASGTAIIDEFHEQHRLTRFPIIYTSADSVFQIACDVDIVPLETLYAWCETARELLDDGYNCSRVIARPYQQTATGLARLGALRRDYSVPPPDGSILDRISREGGVVVAIGKTEDIFVGKGITHTIHTGSNLEGLQRTIDVVSGSIDMVSILLSEQHREFSDKMLVFTNLVDTDMIYGHRRDATGYGRALEQIDEHLQEIINRLTDDDLLIITADHGCDPLAPGSDHTREMVPLLVYSPGMSPGSLGVKPSFTYVSRLVANWVGLVPDVSWAE